MRKILLPALLLLLWSVGISSSQDTPSDDTRVELAIWLPDELFSSALALERMTEQTVAFAQAEDIDVTIRLRRVSDVGGILSTIRVASIVAPDSLPTLTMVRRADLVSAHRDGLLQSFEGLVSSALLTNLGRNVTLGQIDDMLYGLPFTLDFNHIVYRERPETSYRDWSYDAVLARGQGWVFVGGRPNQISETFLLQYLTGNENTRNAEGRVIFSEDSLMQALAFYEEASALDLVRPNVLGFTSQSDYLESFLAGEYEMAVINSSRYLTLRGADDTLRVAELPTVNGVASGLINGWVWVLVTPDTTQHSTAMRYLNWLYQRERYAELLQILQVLPAQTTVLGDVLPPLLTAFYEGIINNGQVIPYTPDSATLVRLFQEALASVITQERTARQASDVVEQNLPKDSP